MDESEEEGKGKVVNYCDGEGKGKGVGGSNGETIYRFVGDSVVRWEVQLLQCIFTLYAVHCTLYSV